MNAITDITCGLLAQGRVRVSLEALQELRKQPGPPGAVPPMFLKNSDEQTVAGLAAVYQAMREPALAQMDFRPWGVIAAPRFLGRTTVGFHLHRYATEGAWGISPHVIPHRTLHSPSGTLSHALKLHGPNYGVGGGPGALTEALLTAAALLHGHELPGLWLVITERNPELKPDPIGTLLSGAFYCAQAIALVPWYPDSALPRLQVSVRAAAPGRAAPVCLDALQIALDRARQLPGPVTLVLDHGGRLEIAWPQAMAASSPTCLVDPSTQPFGAETER